MTTPNTIAAEIAAFRERYTAVCHDAGREPIAIAIFSSATDHPEKHTATLHDISVLADSIAHKVAVTMVVEGMRRDPTLRSILEDAVMQLNTEE